MIILLTRRDLRDFCKEIREDSISLGHFKSYVPEETADYIVFMGDKPRILKNRYGNRLGAVNFNEFLFDLHQTRKIQNAPDYKQERASVKNRVETL